MPARRTRRAIQTSRETLPKNIFTRVTREDEKVNGWKWFQNGSRHGSDEIDVRMLVHQSQAGCIIGKGGLKIKELREVSRRICFVRCLNALSTRDTTSVLRLSRSTPCQGLHRDHTTNLNRSRGLLYPRSSLSIAEDNEVGFASSRAFPPETVSVSAIFGHAIDKPRRSFFRSTFDYEIYLSRITKKIRFNVRSHSNREQLLFSSREGYF